MNDVVRELLSADANAARDGGAGGEGTGGIVGARDRYGTTPIGELRDAWIEAASTDGGRGEILRADGGARRRTGGLSSPAELRGILRVLWDRADMMLRATMGRRDGSDPPPSLRGHAPSRRLVSRAPPRIPRRSRRLPLRSGPGVGSGPPRPSAARRRSRGAPDRTPFRIVVPKESIFPGQ